MEFSNEVLDNRQVDFRKNYRLWQGMSNDISKFDFLASWILSIRIESRFKHFHVHISAQ